MRVAEQRLAGLVGEALAVHQRHHRLPQRLAAGELRVGGLPREQIGDEFARRLRMHRPVGDEDGAGAGIEERAAETGRRLGAGADAAPVLQADSTTQSASSLSARISPMVSKPSPGTPATPARSSASAGSCRPSSSPGTRPWVANTMMRYFDRSLFLTVCSLAALPRLSTFDGSACSAAAIDFSSSAVSGSRGSMPSVGAVDASVCGAARRLSGRPRVVTSPALARSRAARQPSAAIGGRLLLVEQRIAEADHLLALVGARRQLRASVRSAAADGTSVTA